MSTIRPFTIGIPDAQLNDVGKRLAETILPESPDDGWSSGPSATYLRRLLQRFANGYDWRSHEKAINQYPQFLAQIEGQTIHFLHVKSRKKSATPLLLIHGWPSSVAEFLALIPLLTEASTHGGNGGELFDLVIPSLPGFVFSGPTHEKGWNNRRITTVLLELMTQLGYERFGVQGGDAGAIIGPEIGRLAPQRVIGIHVNAATLGFVPFAPLSPEEAASLSDTERVRLQRLQRFMTEHSGFLTLQSNRPQALSFALSDSPVGLLAWISELYTSFGDRPNALDPDVLLTNFLLYWFTNTIATSMYLYFENAHDPQAWAPKANSGVPTAVAVFGNDEVAIRRFGEASNNIVRWTEFDQGGHFAAVEEPMLLAEDMRAFFSSIC